MRVDDSDTAALKQWITPKLTEISEADPDVLAEYLLALLTADEPAENVKDNCRKELREFMPEDLIVPFVDEMLDAVTTRSYISATMGDQKTQAITSTARSTPSADSAATLAAETPSFDPPKGPKSTLSATAIQFNPPRAPAADTNRQPRQAKSKKRTYDHVAGSDADRQHERGSSGERPIKQVARRGGRNSRGGLGVQDTNLKRFLGPTPKSLPPKPNLAAMPSFPPLPNLPSGLPPFDPADPMSLFAMATLLSIPGLPLPPPPSMGLAGSSLPFPAFGSPSWTDLSRPVKANRCRDYDTKGFCVKGSNCPYEHGGEPVVADEYDPNQALLPGTPRNAMANTREQNQKTTRGDSRSRAVRNRAPFSQAGPTTDRSNTTVVVEKIPEEAFSEEAVRGYFAQFGNIMNVDMHAYKRLAVVKFGDHFAAQRAYENPKAIFDNRFVKVYWYKDDMDETSPAKKVQKVSTSSLSNHAAAAAVRAEVYEEDEEILDIKQIEERQAELQKAHEERLKKRRETEERQKEIQKQLEATYKEATNIRRKLAAKTGEESDFVEKLRLLQQEAHTFGIDTTKEQTSPVNRGRGGSRGGAPYRALRGRGYSALRGGFGARGGSTTSLIPGARCGVKRLDNRPKSVAVVEGLAKEEALRTFLAMNNYEYDRMEPDGERENTLIIAFKERYIAECFMDNARYHDDLGKVEVSWVRPAGAAAQTRALSTSATTAAKKEGVPDQREPVGDARPVDRTEISEQADGVNGGEADYDVAEDRDSWMES
ncbi:hypothetical protein BCR34DRAFT_601640 [Clohesyomyces aquaticus]|uniref:C3H1-type domain-containing protein n=1 Tax=Clohesyomyces aquaticus TaxID=1231657 RepID=A0A1Y1ZLB9_9PLEO|nr:hypothetical protein BCR34DRAFT_601640 [Clohesyomyces aquaticus]